MATVKYKENDYDSDELFNSLDNSLYSYLNNKPKRLRKKFIDAYNDIKTNGIISVGDGYIDSPKLNGDPDSKAYGYVANWIINSIGSLTPKKSEEADLKNSEQIVDKLTTLNEDDISKSLLKYEGNKTILNRILLENAPDLLFDEYWNILDLDRIYGKRDTKLRKGKLRETLTSLLTDISNDKYSIPEKYGTKDLLMKDINSAIIALDSESYLDELLKLGINPNKYLSDGLLDPVLVTLRTPTGEEKTYTTTYGLYGEQQKLLDELELAYIQEQAKIKELKNKKYRIVSLKNPATFSLALNYILEYNKELLEIKNKGFNSVSQVLELFIPNKFILDLNNGLYLIYRLQYMYDLLNKQKSELIKNNILYLPHTYDSITKSMGIYNDDSKAYTRMYVGDPPKSKYKDGGILKFLWGGDTETLEFPGESASKSESEYLDYKIDDTSHKLSQLFTKRDIARITLAATDLTSAIAAFFGPKGMATSAILGLGSTAGNAIIDFTDPELSKRLAWRSTLLSAGLDVVGMFPGWGTSAKITKIKKILNPLNAGLMTFFAYSGLKEAGNALRKVINGDVKDITSNDLQALLNGLNIAAFGTLRTVGRRRIDKTGLIVQTSKNQKEVIVPTNSGDKSVLLSNELLKNIKSAKGYDKQNELFRSYLSGDDKVDLPREYTRWGSKYNPLAKPNPTTNNVPAKYEVKNELTWLSLLRKNRKTTLSKKSNIRSDSRTQKLFNPEIEAEARLNKYREDWQNGKHVPFTDLVRKDIETVIGRKLTDAEVVEFRNRLGTDSDRLGVIVGEGTPVTSNVSHLDAKTYRQVDKLVDRFNTIVGAGKSHINASLNSSLLLEGPKPPLLLEAPTTMSLPSIELVMGASLFRLPGVFVVSPQGTAVRANKFGGKLNSVRETILKYKLRHV